MPKPESILVNEMRKILKDFENQTEHLNLARTPYQMRIGKQNYSWLCRVIRPQNETQYKKKKKDRQVVTLCLRTKNLTLHIK